MSTIPHRWRRIRLLLLCGAWLCCVVAGSAGLMFYGAAAGEQGVTPTEWPTDTSLSHRPGVGHLLVFIHPQCPCSLSTLRQLEKALAFVQGNISLQTVVFAPADQAQDWTQTRLVGAAALIPGMRMVMDSNGSEAERFGVRTSGHVLYYDTAGRLAFSGGITPARGHEGGCAGLDALTARLRSGSGTKVHASIFGCPILHRDGRCLEGNALCCQKK